jgi:hypothetical protein
VPTFTCGLVRSNFAFAMMTSRRSFLRVNCATLSALEPRYFAVSLLIMPSAMLFGASA